MRESGPPRGIDAMPKTLGEKSRERAPWLVALAGFMGLTYLALEQRWCQNHQGKTPSTETKPNDGEVSDFILDVVENPPRDAGDIAPFRSLPSIEILDESTENNPAGGGDSNYGNEFRYGADSAVQASKKNELSQNLLSMLSQTFETTATLSSDADLTDTDEEFALVVQDGTTEGEYIFVVNRQGRYWGKIQYGMDGSWQMFTPSGGLTASFETLDDLADYLKDPSRQND
ncbi:hypothetical protein H6758_04020 [Candidatus Nomurabacteria bacterium]|nr:hypothetical protein [Candidatus Nomurabacteria bacterium]